MSYEYTHFKNGEYFQNLYIFFKKWLYSPGYAPTRHRAIGWNNNDQIPDACSANNTSELSLSRLFYVCKLFI